ncbi:hypothetical protein HME9302_01457 [Alteripontixanthobacter maritimus]|uniref:PepSY domain-containing protein n=2 Tax=Alteripontixanthobacter maritimus TaxID=2161824 RepID=A0A369QAL1_9SPHN|nr:hypothetical protein HME9302_01457 [Alteripontixanthobacter maritimus]
MLRFAKWHIWLGWLVGLPILMWTITGLVMVAKPIEEVRGNHLRIADTGEQLLPPGNPAPVLNEIDVPRSVTEIRTVMQRGEPVTFVTRDDSRVTRHEAATGALLDPLNEVQARKIVAQTIKGGTAIQSMKLYEADEVPFDFRRPVPVWQAKLADGTHVYIGRDTAQVEAVRTRWWRIFDTMWGLHIMDLNERENTSHPILIISALLAVIGALLGCILMFRRRKAGPLGRTANPRS